MIFIFLLLFIILVLFLQQWSLDDSLDSVEGDFWPSGNVIEPEEIFQITVRLKNQKRFPLYYVKVEIPFAKGLKIDSKMRRVKENHVIHGYTVTLSTWIKAKEQVLLPIQVFGVQRGRYVLIPPTVSLGDFLGLKDHGKNLEQFREIVIAPKEMTSPEVEQLLGRFLGDFSVRRFLYEDPILTLGYREYTGREPMKMIAWKQSAQRQQTLMVKEYDYTVEPSISVLVNVETSGDFSNEKKELLEKCFSLARSVCSQLESKGIPYDFYTNAQMAGNTDNIYEVNEGLGTRHFTKVLELLGRSMYVSSFSYVKLLELADSASKPEQGKIVITPNDDVCSAVFSNQQLFILKANLL